jgi:hypothetical protein
MMPAAVSIAKFSGRSSFSPFLTAAAARLIISERRVFIVEAFSFVDGTQAHHYTRFPCRVKAVARTKPSRPHG